MPQIVMNWPLLLFLIFDSLFSFCNRISRLIVVRRDIILIVEITQELAGIGHMMIMLSLSGNGSWRCLKSGVAILQRKYLLIFILNSQLLSLSHWPLTVYIYFQPWYRFLVSSMCSDLYIFIFCILLMILGISGCFCGFRLSFWRLYIIIWK